MSEGFITRLMRSESKGTIIGLAHEQCHLGLPFAVLNTIESFCFGALAKFKKGMLPYNCIRSPNGQYAPASVWRYSIQQCPSNYMGFNEQPDVFQQFQLCTRTTHHLRPGTLIMEFERDQGRQLCLSKPNPLVRDKKKKWKKKKKKKKQ